MGLTTSNSERTTFLNIIEGKICKKTNQENPLATARVNKKGDTVYEQRFDKLEAKIVSMKIDKDDYGKKLVIELEEAADRYTLTLPVESKYFDHFCAKIGNVDRNHLIIIAPYSFVPKGEAQKRTGLNFFQHGNKVEYYFTEVQPKGKPMPNGKLDEDDWKIYKMQERKFYCEYITGLDAPKEVNRDNSKPEPQGDDLPF